MKSALLFLLFISSSAFALSPLTENCFIVNKSHSEKVVICNAKDNLYYLGCGGRIDACYTGTADDFALKVNLGDFFNDDVGINYAERTSSNHLIIEYHDVGNMCQHIIPKCE